MGKSSLDVVHKENLFGENYPGSGPMKYNKRTRIAGMNITFAFDFIGSSLVTSTDKIIRSKLESNTIIAPNFR